MKRTFKFSLFIIFLYISTIFPHTDTNVVATVGKYKILKNDFAKRYENYLFSTGITDRMKVRKKILNDMIDEIVLQYYDDNSHFESLKTYQTEVEWLRKQAILAYLKDQDIYVKINVTDEEAKKAFLRMNQKIAVRHLFAKTKEEADKLFEMLQMGFTFKELATEVFSDSLLRNNGGYLGYFSWGDLDPAFEEKAFSMKVGEISKPVKTEYGYSIIKVEDKVTKPIIAEDEFLRQKSKIIRAVKINRKKPAEEAYMRSLINFSDFNFNETCLEKLFASLKMDTSGNIIIKPKFEFSNKICVKYKNKSLNEKNLIEKLDEIPFYHLEKVKSEDKLKAIIKGIFLQDTLMNIAHNNGYDTLKIVKETFNKLKTNLFMKFKKIEVLRNIIIPDSVVKQFYEDHIDFFSTHDEINIREIILNDSIKAYQIYSELKVGKDFDILAKKYSVRKQTAKIGGIVGFTSIEKFGKLSKIFWNSKKLDLIGPLYLNGYWGIFKIINKMPGKRLEFGTVRDQVEMLAKYTFQKVYFENYISNIRKRISISINYRKLGNIKILLNNNFSKYRMKLTK